MFSDEYYAKLDPSYCKLLKELVAKVEENDYDENEKVLKEFCENYMLPVKLWDIIYEIFCYEEKQPFCYYQFYVTKDIALQCDLKYSHKLLNLKTSLEEDQRYEPYLLGFPNYDLDEILRRWETHADRQLSKAHLHKYEKMRPLYDKIISVEEDSEAWFKALTEAEDIEFVKHNVEYRLGGDLTDKKLWKLYLKYLEVNDVEAMLHTYSKYCRFFLDDAGMKKKYKNAVEKFGESVKVPWENPFEFEKCRPKITQNLLNEISEKKRRLYVPPEEKIVFFNPESRKRKVPPHFSTDFIQKQNTPFKSSLLHYVFKNSDHYLKQKFLRTCKYFFATYPKPLCYKLDIKNNFTVHSDGRKHYQSHHFACQNLEQLQFKDYHVTTVFQVEGHRAEKEFNYSLSKMLCRIYQCDAKYVILRFQKQILTLKELNFLIGHGNILQFTLEEIKCIFEENGKDVPLEEILKLTPKIMFLSIHNPVFTSETAQILAKLPFQNKICLFKFKAEKNEFEPHAFVEFIKKNAAPRCIIQYKFGTHSLTGPNFDEILEDAINEHWQGKKEKPCRNTY